MLSELCALCERKNLYEVCKQPNRGISVITPLSIRRGAGGEASRGWGGGYPYIRLQKPIDYQEKTGVKARRGGYPPILTILIILIDSHLQILYIVPTKYISVLKIVIKD